MTVLKMFVLAAALTIAAPVFAQESANMTMEILKEKVKADKKLLVASNMNLTDVESKGFWPLYESYQKELDQINQRVGATIRSYADAHNAGKGMIPNETAKKLLKDALANEEAELKLRQSYAAKLEKVLPATKVARYLQIENKIRAILKFELAQQIPLVQ
ncbi:MAG: hypothetical protein ACREI9_06890 [Nitrospiraceae bacterium]